MNSEIGIVNDYPVYYNESNDTLECKDVIAKADDILNAYSSRRDRIKVKGNLTMQKNITFVKIGCLEIKYPLFKQLVKNLKNVRNTKKN